MATTDPDSATQRCSEPMQAPTVSAAVAATTDPHSYTRNHGDHSGVPLATILPQLQSQSQPQSQSVRCGENVTTAIEDSGTESGEDLRLLNPQLLDEVRGALNKLENALPALDAARRTSIIPLVNKLQSCLKVSGGAGGGETSSASAGTSPVPQQLLSPKPATNAGTVSGRNRKARHTIGVSREELDDARKWLAVAQNVTNQLDNDNDEDAAATATSSCTPTPSPAPASKPMKFDSPNSTSKGYKPVKFTPITMQSPASDAHQVNETLTKSKSKTQPQPSSAPLYCTSDEGDVSSAGEETNVTTPAATNAPPWLCQSANEPLSSFKKMTPSRFQRKNSKSTRMKRANTIDVPNPSDSWAWGDDHQKRYHNDAAIKVTTVAPVVAAVGGCQPVPPTLQLKTENDKKFAAFLQQTKQEESQSHSKTVAYNPSAAGGLQWSARFSNIKTAFESTDSPTTPTPTPTPASAAAAASTVAKPSASFFEPIHRPTSATLPRHSFTHAQKSPFKPVTKVAPFHMHAPSSPIVVDSAVAPSKPKSSAFKMGSTTAPSADQPVHAPKTYYPPATASDGKISHSQRYPADRQHHHPHQPHYPHPQHLHYPHPHHQQQQQPHQQHQHRLPFGDPHSNDNSRKKPLTPSMYYPKPDYFLNEPSSYISQSNCSGSSSQPCSPRPAFFVTSPPIDSFNVCTSIPSAYGDPNAVYRSLPTSPNNDMVVQTHPSTTAEMQRLHQNQSQSQNRDIHASMEMQTQTLPLQQQWNKFRQTDNYSEECAPVAKIMGKPQQSVATVVNSKTTYHQQQQPQQHQQQKHQQHQQQQPLQHQQQHQQQKHQHQQHQQQQQLHHQQQQHQHQQKYQQQQQQKHQHQQHQRQQQLQHQQQQQLQHQQQHQQKYQQQQQHQKHQHQQHQQQQQLQHQQHQQHQQQQNQHQQQRQQQQQQHHQSSILNTYQKLAEKSPSLQNFTKTQPKTWSSQKSSSSPSLPNESPQPSKKQIRIVTLNESEENLPEQFFVQNQKNKFESMSRAADGNLRAPASTSWSQVNEKAYFKPLTVAAAHTKVSPTIVVQQSRSPPQSPVIMPSVLQKSESWHQMIMEKMKQAKPPSPIRQNIPRAKSTHNLSCMPKQYEPAFSAQDISVKQQTVEQFLNKDKRSRSQTQKQTMMYTATGSASGISTHSGTSQVKVDKLNEDFKHVDEAFEILFEEASGRIANH
ncbi:mucin-2-like [Planococcus citri]|uniref:mucin-2-like n=1 Tax=Planococcus citri TaxID=170843 RepID=UPI0031F77559